MAKQNRNRNSYDESDVRIRAPKSKPRRSKDRPDYSKLAIGFVTTVDRGRSRTILESEGSEKGQLESSREVTAMKARELGKNSVVVGDLVRLDGDISGAEGSLARIVEVLPRTNSLSRTVDDIGAQEKFVAANVDQLVIVVAAANPEPRHGFVDRCLAVAFDQRITPILVITKSDLADPENFLDAYKALEIKCFKSSLPREKRENSKSNLLPPDLLKALQGKKSVLIGHSGVGKSTLVNSLLQNKARETGDVNLATGRGRHTSSSAHALELPGGGWIIDTPGVRSFGLEHIDRSRIISSFGELAELIERCPKNCSHNESECALNSVPAGSSIDLRIKGLRRILAATSD